ncbi:MAG: YCF48-related protein [Balneolaceae bacterium]
MCFSLIFAPSVNSQDWFSQDSGVNADLNDIHFMDHLNGWAVGDDGTIIHTKDGGISWKKQNSTTYLDLNAVHFMDHLNGLVVGRNGIIIHTNDGGQNWIKNEYSFIYPDELYVVKDEGRAQRIKKQSISPELEAVHFTDLKNGWAVGASGTIIHTKDGGENWSRQTSRSDDYLYDIYFTDNKNGWAIGSRGFVVQTKDGGENWNVQSFPGSSLIFAVHFTDLLNGWVVGYNGLVVQTKDGGENWNEQALTDRDNLYAVHFINHLEGWAGGRYGSLFMTNDGGQTWKKQNLNINTIRSLYFINSVNGWAAGEDGTILKTSVLEITKKLYPFFFETAKNSKPELLANQSQFETTEEYEKRRLKAEDYLRKELESYIQEENRKKVVQIAESIEKVNFNVILNEYEADEAFYSITVNGGTYKIKIPRDEAQQLFQEKENLQAEAISKLSDNLKDKEIVNINIINPITGQKYPFGPQIDLEDFEIEKVESINLPPQLAVSEPVFTDTNGDNILGAGESATISLTIGNEGEGLAQNFQILGQSTAAIDGLKANVGDLKSGEERSISLTLTGNESLKDGEAEIDLNFQENGGFEPASIRIVIPTQAYRPPTLSIAEIAVEDDQGRGIIEPGRVANITVRLQNTGEGAAENVKINFQAGENIYLQGRARGTQSETIGRLAPGEWRDISLESFSNNRAEQFPIIATVTEAKGKYGFENRDLGLELNKQQLTTRELIIQGRELQKQRKTDLPSLNVDIETNIPRASKMNEDAIAVIIGNQDYRGDTPDVTYAIRDVSLTRKYLQEAFGFKPGNILYYENATLGEMRTVFGTESSSGRLKDLVKKDRSDVFVFYSGHGAPSTDEKGTGYLIPIDGSATNVEATGYNLNLLYENLSKIESRSTTVVIDACFSGASGSGEMLIEQASPIGIRVNNPAATLGEKAVVISAASGSEIASWHTENRYGLLTYYFLKAVQGDADLNQDQKITAEELRKYLTNPSDGLVYNARALHGREQTPQVFGADDKVILELD